jgi:tetratricopeptide (TPR) repeat protein
LAATAALVILALMIVAWFQVSYWRNTETLFAHAIDVTTDNAMAHNNLAAALDDQGKTEEAIAHYREAIRINPNYADAHNNLGIALGSRGDIDEAIEHYEKALTRKPDDPDINCNIGVALAATGRLDEAVVHFTKALRVAPGSVRAHYSLGLALAQQGRGAKAIPHFREVLRLSPKNPQAANDLAWLLATNPDEKLRNGAEAVQLAERACRMTDFRNPGTLDTLAAAYAEDGRFEDALATARKALTLAVSSGPPGLAEELRKRLRLYEKRQPFHQAARAVRSP